MRAGPPTAPGRVGQPVQWFDGGAFSGSRSPLTSAARERPRRRPGERRGAAAMRNASEVLSQAAPPGADIKAPCPDGHAGERPPGGWRRLACLGASVPITTWQPVLNGSTPAWRPCRTGDRSSPAPSPSLGGTGAAEPPTASVHPCGEGRLLRMRSGPPGRGGSIQPPEGAESDWPRAGPARVAGSTPRPRGAQRSRKSSRSVGTGDCSNGPRGLRCHAAQRGSSAATPCARC
jgi:hypothetical protein